MEYKSGLVHRLRKYVNSGIHPFHMPGHKRQMPPDISNALKNIEEIDLTELEASDNLHRPRGVIREALEYARSVYNSNRTYFLINGSSCGILAAINTCANLYKGKNQEKILLFGDNAHISVYHALELCKAKAEYIHNDKVKGYGFAASTNPQKIKEKLRSSFQCGKLPFAVLVTSPTYEGVVSDIKSIAQIVHAYGIPLIVDEAHGAHLRFFEKDGNTGISSALDSGADIVVQSLHKTMPALTQTALLHLKSDLVSAKKIEHALRIFQSTSPSYILLSSIDLAIRYMNEEGKSAIKKFLSMRQAFLEKMHLLPYIKIWEGGGDEIYKKDLTKLVIGINKDNTDMEICGTFIQKFLRDKAGVEVEMAAESYVLAIIGVCDTKDGFQKLEEGLCGLDEWIGKRQTCGEKDDFFNASPNIKEEKYYQIKALEGSFAKEHIYAYPPGIPIIKKGEYIDGKKTEEILRYIKSGIEITFYN